MGMGLGIGLDLAGGVLNSIAATQARGKMYGAFQDELNRQRGYSNQAYGAFLPALDKLSRENADKEVGQGAMERRGMYDSIGSRPMSVSGSGPTTRDKNLLGMYGGQRASVGGLSDWQLDRAIDDIRLNQQLHQIGNFAQGTASVFPYRMYQAQHSMDEMKFWGDLISSVGGGASMSDVFKTQAPPQQQITPMQAQGTWNNIIGKLPIFQQ